MSQCFICHSSTNQALWRDAIKRNGKCHTISGIAEYDEKSDTYLLDELIQEEVKRLKNFNSETEELTIMSFKPDEFTKEDILQMDFGIEDCGAHCLYCNAIV